MSSESRGNVVLRQALAAARLRDIDVAASLGVDPKTVHRWLDGRTPQPRHRWALADLVGAHEFDLWPELAGAGPIGPELLATYPHRGAVPREVWRRLFTEARHEIGVLVYSGLFIAEDVELVRLIGRRAEGVSVRILLGDPEHELVAQRGREEGIDDAMPAKVRNAIVLFGPLASTPGVEIRLHSTVLYNSIYRGDDTFLVNPHVYGLAAAHAPVLHLRRRDGGDLVETYAASFDRVWSGATALPVSCG
jgi:hypothetical protein